jgi:hypothetical protein
MLASITPLGERGRRSKWGITVTAFMIGATVAGAAFGAALGLLGGMALDGTVSIRMRLVLLTGVLVAAVAIDLLLDVVPGPRRQVNERWLDEFRGWVYGIGFGAQLGLGVTTIVTSAATYVAIAAAVLVGGPVGGAIVLGCYGAVRGAMPLLAARVDHPEALIAMHRRIDRWRAPAGRLSTVSLAGVLVVAAAGSLV